MTSLADLFAALPITSPSVRVGNQTSCGGIAGARIEILPADTYEVVNAVPPSSRAGTDDQELIDFCVTNVAEGVAAELTEIFGEFPPVRVVVHEVLPHAVDSNESINRRAGQSAVQQALHNAGLNVEAPGPGNSFRVVGG